MITKLGWPTVFSALDFPSAYWQIEVKHYEGRNNILPDYLSRIKVREKDSSKDLIAAIRVCDIDPKWTKETIVGIQQRDEYTREIMKMIRDEEYDATIVTRTRD